MKAQSYLFIVAGLAATLLLAASPAWAMNLRVVSIDGPAGGKVEIALEAEDADELGPIQMLLLFDNKVLEIDEVETGDVYDGSVEFNSDNTGELTILMLSDTDKGVNQDGPIAIVKANVIGQPGDKSSLGLRHVRAWKRDTSNPTEFDVVTADGELTVVSASVPWLFIAAIAGGVCLIMLVGIALTRGRGEPASPSKSTNDHMS